MARHLLRRDAGITLLEILIVLAIFGFLAAATLEFFATWVPRTQLRHSARELAQVIQRARLTAIQRGVTAVVRADPTSGEVSAFADIEGNDLVYLPDPAIPGRRTDFSIAQQHLRGVSFGGPSGIPGGADAFDGLTPVPGDPPTAPPVLALEPDGTPRDGGGFRMLDGDGDNVFEIAIEAVTGRVEIRKYLRAGDAPDGIAGFFPPDTQGHGTRDGAQWVWY